MRKPLRRLGAPTLADLQPASAGRIEVTRRAKHRESGHHFIGVRFPTGDGHQSEEMFLPSEVAARPHLVQDLLLRHGYVPPSSGPAQYRGLVQAAAASGSKAPCELTNRTGWDHESNYILPHETLRGPGATDVVYWGDAGGRREDAASGTLTSWNEGVAMPAAASRLGIVATCAALAPVLLRFGPFESGIFHVYGASGTGKTTLAKLAASVWRGGDQATDTWNTTPAALEELFERRNDNVVCLDEVGLAGTDPQSHRSVVRGATYAATQTKGRRRSKYFAGSAQQAPFRYFGISTGEESAADIAEAVGVARRRGEEARVIDIPVASSPTGVFDRLAACGHARTSAASSEVAASLNRAVGENYGTAGPAFVRYVIANLQSVEAEVTRHVAAFLHRVEAPSDGWGRRIATKFALAYAAGRLAIEAGILPWSSKTMRAAVRATYARPGVRLPLTRTSCEKCSTA